MDLETRKWAKTLQEIVVDLDKKVNKSKYIGNQPILLAYLFIFYKKGPLKIVREQDGFSRQNDGEQNRGKGVRREGRGWRATEESFKDTVSLIPGCVIFSRIGQFNLRSRCFEIAQIHLMSKHLQTQLVNLAITLTRGVNSFADGGIWRKKGRDHALK